MIKEIINYFTSLVSKLRQNDFEKEYLSIKNLNKIELLDFQKSKLEKLLIHTYNNVPYYRNTFDEIGLIKNGRVDLSKFNHIPILTKDIIRNNRDKLVSDDLTRRKPYYNRTGGSTGEPLLLIQDKNYIKGRNSANRFYYEDMCGINEKKSKKIILWGSERDLFSGNIGFKKKFLNWLTNSIFLNSFKMTGNDMQRYSNLINSYKPDLIRGYASSLYELSLFVNKNQIKVHKPDIIISAAENLSPKMRKEIEKTFKTKVRDFYGSREVSGLAGECEKGLLHIFAFWNYVEILSEKNEHVKEGETGRVIVTNLFNYSMPLIRYEIGDMAELGPEQCECGNILPTLKGVTGRITDHFSLENGTKIPGEFFIHLIGVVTNKGYIKKFQIIQEDYNKIKIRVVPEKKIPLSYIKDVNDKIMVVMGENCSIEWKYVPEIEKTSSGKYLYTISRLDKHIS